MCESILTTHVHTHGANLISTSSQLQNLMHALVGPAKLLLSSQVSEKLAIDKINDTKTVDLACDYVTLIKYHLTLATCLICAKIQCYE